MVTNSLIYLGLPFAKEQFPKRERIEDPNRKKNTLELIKMFEEK